MKPRLHTDLWIKAHIRTCHANNIPAFVVARGDAERGGVLLKINHFKDGVELLQPTTNMEGDRVWMPVMGKDVVDERSADAFIAKRRSTDSDLWVVEIEDNDGRYELGEQIDG